MAVNYPDVIADTQCNWLTDDTQGKYYDICQQVTIKYHDFFLFLVCTKTKFILLLSFCGCGAESNFLELLWN